MGLFLLGFACGFIITLLMMGKDATISGVSSGELRNKKYEIEYLRAELLKKPKADVPKRNTTAAKYYDSSDFKNEYNGPVEYYYEEKHIDKMYLYPQKNIINTHVLNGKKIVFTGDYSNLKRNEMARMAWEVGADVDTAISNKTFALIKGDNYGQAKLDRVEYLKDELGITVNVVSETEFLEMFVK